MTKLARELTLYGLIMVAIGSCIGSGIFVTPARDSTFGSLIMVSLSQYGQLEDL